MTTANARAAVKQKLDIAALSTFDTQIDADVLDAVKRLYPMAQREATPVTATVSVTAGRAEIDLSALGTPLAGVRRIEFSSDGSTWSDHSDTYQHGSKLIIDNLESWVTTVKLYGLARYALTDLEPEFELAVVFYASAAFYEFLLGNKRKFSIYTQAAGARSADDMRDQATFFENKANTYLADRATLYGAS